MWTALAFPVAAGRIGRPANGSASTATRPQPRNCRLPGPGRLKRRDAGTDHSCSSPPKATAATPTRAGQSSGPTYAAGDLQLAGSAHNSFSDIQVLVPQAAGVLNLPPDAANQLIGTIDPHRSIINQRAYLTAFFNLHLRHRDNHLLDHPSARFPEMQFVP